MSVWIVAQVAFAGVVICGAMALAAIRLRSDVQELHSRLRSQAAALRASRERFKEAKEQLVKLQGEHEQLASEVYALRERSDYVENVLKQLKGDAELPAARSAKAVLSAVVDGMNTQTDPAKTARNVITLTFSTDRERMIKKTDGQQSDFKTKVRTR